MTTIVSDADLRDEFSRCGPSHTAKFSFERYSETSRGALPLAALNFAAGRRQGLVGSARSPFHLWQRPVRVGRAPMWFPAIGASFWTRSAGRYGSSFNRVIENGRNLAV
jgi:hypothetical protein